MHRNDEDAIERYLKTFRPRPIRPLQVQPASKYRRLVAAAALITITVAIGYWRYRNPEKSYPASGTHSVQQSTVPEHLSVTLLTKLAVDDEPLLDKYLAEKSRTTLPDMKGKQSALRVLAKE
jgi:hypothetical protein